ncbi:helix-turn-helix domain-containing protein [Sphingomonas faeni]|uniref:helix-turn-helix domain-containing protein n=1 Tax=Sphingomonas faeni TaxID=185950 RepID=UPI00334C7E06
MTTTVDLDDLLSNEQTAAILGVKPNTLEIWRCKGKGPAFIKLGAHPSSPIRYQRSRLMAWLDAQSFTSTSAYAVSARSA